MGGNPVTYTEVGTGRSATGQIGSIFMARPGYQGLTRMDVMTLMVHELRHAGQFYSIFSNERVRGQRLSCPIISGHIAEVDSWHKTNHWVVNSALAGFVTPNDFGEYYGETNIAGAAYNAGILWSKDELWDHQIIEGYRGFYKEKFDIPPIFNCPGSSQASQQISCVEGSVNLIE